MTLYLVQDIRPNPFRHMDRYPIRQDKVAALRESLRTTGFWDNIVARVGEDGHPEIAYGHHRLVALQEELGPDTKVRLNIRELDDDHMLKIMARENMEEWGTSASVEHETVRAVVEAYAAGKITLPTDPSPRAFRLAPGFTVSNAKAERSAYASQRVYTAPQIAHYLGWLKPKGDPQDKIHSTLDALAFIEEGILTEAQFDGQSTNQAKTIVDGARRAKARREREAKVAEDEAAKARQAREAAATRQEQEAAARREQASEARAAQLHTQARQEAAAVGAHASTQLREGRAGYREGDKLAAEAVGSPEAKAATADAYARQFSRQLNRTLRDDKLGKSLQDLHTNYLPYLSAESIKELTGELQALATRATNLVTAFTTPKEAGQ